MLLLNPEKFRAKLDVEPTGPSDTLTTEPLDSGGRGVYHKGRVSERKEVSEQGSLSLSGPTRYVFFM